MTDSIEKIILKELVSNEPFFKKVIPFIKNEYFSEDHERIIFEKIFEFFQKYSKQPTTEALLIDIGNTKGINEKVFERTVNTLQQFEADPKVEHDYQWLIDRTETFCRDTAMTNAVLRSYNIVQGEDKAVEKTIIPELMRQALAVNFDVQLGMDFSLDAERRYDLYTHREKVVPFDIEMLNKTTNGGVPTKTLNIIIAGVNVGKSLIMCNWATHYLKMGKNVVYFTLEMAEDRVMLRIDANILDVDIDSLKDPNNFPKSHYLDRVNAAKKITTGKLRVKYFQQHVATAAIFKQYLDELKIQEGWTPDIILIDYLGLASSYRIKAGPTVNSYTMLKAVSEEFRDLGNEVDAMVWTGAQLKRSAFGSSDPDLDDIADSFAIAATADFAVTAIQTEVMAQLRQYLFGIIKNRYGDKNALNKFIVGVDTTRMRLFNVDQNGQIEGEIPYTLTKPPSAMEPDFSVKRPVKTSVFAEKKELSNKGKFTGWKI